jgi:hypothetical protein
MSRLRRATAFIPLIAALGAISVLPGAAQGAHGGFCSAELAEGAPDYNVIYAVAGVATQGSDGDDVIFGANVGQDGPATSDTCDGGRGADTDRGAFCDSSSNIETSTAS